MLTTEAHCVCDLLVEEYTATGSCFAGSGFCNYCSCAGIWFVCLFVVVLLFKLDQMWRT